MRALYLRGANQEAFASDFVSDFPGRRRRARVQAGDRAAKEADPHAVLQLQNQLVVLDARGPCRSRPGSTTSSPFFNSASIFCSSFAFFPAGE